MHHKLTLLSWNIWVEEKIENILDTVKLYSPDILCLQEVTRNSTFNPGIHTAEYLADRLGYEVYSPDSQVWIDWHKEAQCNAILSKYPIRQYERQFVTEPYNGNPPNWWSEGRTYIECLIELPVGVLTVGTTHLSYSHAFEQNDHRKAECKKICDFISRHKERYIIAGDFNSVPGSYTINQISKVLTHCGPNFDRMTWTTKPFDHGGFRADELNWRIDYAFATPDVQVTLADVVITKYSDHLPLMFNLVINGA